MGKRAAVRVFQAQFSGARVTGGDEASELWLWVSVSHRRLQSFPSCSQRKFLCPEGARKTYLLTQE